MDRHTRSAQVERSDVVETGRRRMVTEVAKALKQLCMNADHASGMCAVGFNMREG
jgi:hypothetical protein